MTSPITAYLTRVTQHLATVDHAEQLAFLDRQIKRWSDLYGAFSRMVDGSEDYTGSATAFDFLETISGLDMMKKEREHVHM
jgi:hypothetical protein